jgi:ribosomal protein L20A (L18A)
MAKFKVTGKYKTSAGLEHAFTREVTALNEKEAHVEIHKVLRNADATFSHIVGKKTEEI